MPETKLELNETQTFLKNEESEQWVCNSHWMLLTVHQSTCDDDRVVQRQNEQDVRDAQEELVLHWIRRARDLSVHGTAYEQFADPVRNTSDTRQSLMVQSIGWQAESQLSMNPNLQ